MYASINNKNCIYKPGKSFITQNHLLFFGKKKHREKVHNTGTTQGILSRLECGHPDIFLFKAEDTDILRIYLFIIIKYNNPTDLNSFSFITGSINVGKQKPNAYFLRFHWWGNYNFRL